MALKLQYRIEAIALAPLGAARGYGLPLHAPLPARREVRMCLTKKPTMTPKKIAAHQANGERPHRPANAEGREHYITTPTELEIRMMKNRFAV
jgi:hypothetical protein